MDSDPQTSLEPQASKLLLRVERDAEAGFGCATGWEGGGGLDRLKAELMFG